MKALHHKDWMTRRALGAALLTGGILTFVLSLNVASPFGGDLARFVTVAPADGTLGLTIAGMAAMLGGLILSTTEPHHHCNL